ncbi:polysaccharide biosynthesis/export family protein [Dyadobacter fanqingshengii]|uniref:Polysaccharide biosynthesis/export family protein n=1 Tax=Dyadobacter fanqingshengii TaxID=2906443 RepID=A0A9X1PC98_9BACT|nr:polysaccharide biosynthesis/export family protein [Dyadobacter fanqingshengii]MCF0042549.1 polysaccharide biosynthesis/export family protein [Dyadobacter fanqingshengii]MCF2504677.1 polysaccharide biosynthesis/export family protein [Dyadobacter fanqingshengii]USJ36223.1 polysaccharide biosynthesis/export family protein [Dyadobacter fanqingshengii]
MNIRNAAYIITLLFLSSCGSYKHIPYFQDLKPSEVSQEEVSNFSAITIQKADILGINVNSRNPESSAIFNYNLNRANGPSMDQPSDSPVVGYLVDEKGEINLPLVGNMKVAGMTTSELREKLSQTLLTYYKDPVVNIRLLNFKVSVFGDVARPDVYRLQNERTTITQALSLAGDLNITAMRTNILLVREQDGKRSFITIDLTSKKLFDSPYYYLKNNDEIYVQPDRTKYATVDRGYRVTTLILSGLSIIAIVLSNLYR